MHCTVHAEPIIGIYDLGIFNIIIVNECYYFYAYLHTWIRSSKNRPVPI